MGWQVTVVFRNQTQYNITLTHNTTGDITTMSPNTNYKYVTEDINNTIAMKLWQQENVYYMQGSLAFGPEAGVYIDRGWLPEDSQNITLSADVNGTDYKQTTNGGATVLAWNQFPNGGVINLRYNQLNGA
jgi:hypothetical protein